MKSWIWVAMLVVLVGGCPGPGLPEADFGPAGPHFKLVTYNVNWGFVEPAKVVEHILQTNADLMCFQETHRWWEAALTRGLKERYPYYAFRDWPGAGGIAMMSKYELQNVRLLRPTEGWFPGLLAEVDTPVGLVQVLNVHLRPALSDKGSFTPSAYYRAPEIHLKELEEFISHADADKPLIIAGDFNEHEDKAAMRWLTEQGYSDALSTYDTYSKTWRWKMPLGLTLENRYDHIVMSKQLDCTGARVTRVEASDHMPVLAVITAKEAQ
jgi:endonuclease/exonuclease/phosphatase family metal-dependent hydrolase